MTKSELLANLPPEFSKDLVGEIHDLLREIKKTLVILDDDPTGTQTVFDVPVLTDLSPNAVRDAIDEAPPVLFLLTNSRALTVAQTTDLHQNLGTILKEFEDDIIVISRSDSTLRGHFPLETNILKEALGIPDAPTLFIPFFEAGGRLTVNDTHYVVEGDTATPAHLTPFANDNAFPFTHSYLPDYFAEKSGGLFKKEDAQSLSLEDLRSGDITEKLDALPDGCTCAVNATSLTDLNVLSLALLKSERRFIIRSAASFVQSLAGIVSRPPLEPWQMQDLDPNPNGGLIIVGSHVPKTTAQLNHLLANAPNTVPLELHVPSLLENPDDTLFPLSAQLNQTIESGKTAILFTSRDRIDAPNEEANLAISQTISRALVSLVQSVVARPSFLIAKGGITSSDIATDALGVKTAHVLGQILPGVPVWTIGNETRHPGLAYIIFPGNVGGDDALTQAYQKLTS
ncbi:MAG: four-carbon acid sugar kinase family protein [Verrucomicrobiaceae bacterium]